MQITLLKEHDVLNYIITLFSILQNEASNKELIVESNKVFVRPKAKADINKLKTETSKLEQKIFDFLDNKTQQKLDLNKKESELLRHCSHAAYYFLTEKKYNFSSAQQAFIRFHEHYKKIK